MKEKVLIVDRICKLIKEKGLTNQKVETELGWGSGAIKKFDSNRPSIDKIIELAEYLGVSVNDIIFDNINERTLSDEETKLINIYRQLSQSNKSKVMERSEILLDSENSNEKYIELFNLPVSAGSGIYLATEDKKYEPIPLNDTVSCRGKVIGKLNKKDILEQD